MKIYSITLLILLISCNKEKTNKTYEVQFSVSGTSADYHCSINGNDADDKITHNGKSGDKLRWYKIYVKDKFSVRFYVDKKQVAYTSGSDLDYTIP
jgi:hypothetical protein